MKKKNLFFIVCSLLFLFCGCETNPDESTKNIVLDSIYISRKPAKLNYDYDEPLDLTGLVVTAKYSDGSEKNVEDWNSFPAPYTKLTSAGEMTISILYETKTVSFSVTVKANAADENANQEQEVKKGSVTGANASSVISAITSGDSNTVCITGKVTSDDFTNINAALQAITAGVILDFSTADFEAIPENAFKDCSNLKEIVIPECVIKIGNFAFNGCSGLTKVKLEDGSKPLKLGYNNYENYFTNKSKGLFRDCPLKELYLGRNIVYEAYVDNSPDTNYSYYGWSAFGNIKSNDFSVTIGPKVTGIQPHSFHGCESLTKVTIKSELIETIGDSAFEGCNNLPSFEIPATVTIIGSSAFSGCAKLREITISEKVTGIDNFAFNGCSGLTKLTMEDGSKELKLGYNNYEDYFTNNSKGLFRDCPLKELYLGRNIGYYKYNDKAADSHFEYYGYSAFANISSTNLTVTIGKEVTSIQPHTFHGCESLSEVNIQSKQIESIGDSAFEGCKNLSSFTIPAEVTGIGNTAFSECEKLEEITIPEKVNSIGDKAFNGCIGLKKLSIENGKESLKLGCNNYEDYFTNNSKGLFRDCPLESLTLGRQLEYSGYSDKASAAHFEYYGYSAFANITTLNKVTINVSDGVDSYIIGKYAFKGCTGITSATFNKTDNWYSSASASMTDGTAVDVSDTAKGAEVLKAMAENYLYWKNQ